MCFLPQTQKNYPYFGEPNQISKLSAGIGANPIKLRKRMELVDVVGDASYLSLGGYYGTVSTNPSTLVYCSIAQSNPNATALTNGSFVRCEIKFEVEFFGRKNFNV